MRVGALPYLGSLLCHIQNCPISNSNYGFTIFSHLVTYLQGSEMVISFHGAILLVVLIRDAEQKEIEFLEA